MLHSLFSFEGKHVLVVGGATGMGAAAAKLSGELGARVTVIDVAGVDYAVDHYAKVDLRDQENVDGVLAEFDAPFDAVFSCAGVADGTPGIMLINFISQRHIISELVGRNLLSRGAGVVMISSVAGLPWQQNMTSVMDFLTTNDWASAAEWIEQHDGTDNYSFSKQALNGYVASEALNLLKSGVRINSVMPGPTDTPLARANADVWLGFGADYREAAGVDPLTPQQIANAMAFLASDAASGISGTNLLIDLGHVSSGMTGSFEAPMIKMMMGIA